MPVCNGIFFVTNSLKHRMKRTPLILIASAMLICACSNDGTKSQREASKDSANAMAESMDDISNSAIRFATDAATANLKEIELGKLAIRNGNYQRLKDFGQRMIDAHTQANSDLQRACYTAGVTLPAGMPQSDQEDIDKLAGKKGKDFDKDYVKKLVSEHQKTMEKLDAAATNIKDTALQNYAKKTLPVVKEHLEEVRLILADVRKQYDPVQFDDKDSYQRMYQK